MYKVNIKNSDSACKMINRCDITDKHFNELRKFDLLSDDEFDILFIKYKNGDIAAGHTIINSNLRIAVVFAKQFQQTGVPITDLIGAANLGLTLALSKYNKDVNVKYTSYARFHILGQIYLLIDQYKNVIKIPVEMKKQLSKNKNESFDIFDPEYCVTPKRPTMCSIDVEMYDNTSTTLASMLGNHDSSFDADILSKYDDVKYAVSKLPKDDIYLIELYFGLNGYESMTLKELSKYTEINECTLRQKINKSLYKLKKSLNYINIK
jgi:RNA polymerase primary sigma factor